ncbi:DUF6734 family protein [Prevotella sp. HCN-7019]|uniref:DUF6734 family protein n=1 Tax=Prevotella sp. HCN-7019 TaxID=3134668 RepID=UPI0030BD7337
MNIVQTFWTNNKDLFTNNFGWINAQANLISWTLSCLTLRNKYDNVKLYTDSLCAKVFIDKLQLPYNEVIVCYDNLDCHTDHWAYPKILTYSKQESPFIHVDGDLFLPQGFPLHFEKATLIAQNKEKGTSYYKNMMMSILQMNPKLPSYLIDELKKESIGSYNAGILGGNDIEFIKKYTDEALKIIYDNNLNSHLCLKNSINYNILFEQILFYVLTKKASKNVETIIEEEINDNGYSCNDFCNFCNFNNSTLLHLLGGHKKNKELIKQMERTLLYKYPEYYLRILKLFPNKNIRINKQNDNNRSLEITIESCITKYYDWQEAILNKWKHISLTELLNVEKNIDGNLSFINENENENEKNKYIFKLHPFLEIFTIPETWPNKAKEMLCQRLSHYSIIIGHDIVCIPCLEDKGYKEIIIGDISYNIITIISNKNISFKTINNKLWDSISGKMAKDKINTQSIINKEFRFLLDNGIIYAKK